MITIAITVYPEQIRQTMEVFYRQKRKKKSNQKEINWNKSMQKYKFDINFLHVYTADTFAFPSIPHRYKILKFI